MTETNTKDTGPDLAGLEDFVRDGDRAKPLCFVGREEEIRNVQVLIRIAQKGKSGLTEVIEGAPGAGKTALLQKLQALCKESGAARPVSLDADIFSAPARVIEKMLQAMDPEAAERFRVTAKREAQSAHTTQRTNLPTSFFAAFQEMEDRETPVVLLVDEAQRWGTNRGDEKRPFSRFSSLLHEAHLNSQRLPLLIVAAGSGDARYVVGERSGSNLKTSIDFALGALSHNEMAQACDAFFERFRIAGSEAQRAEWTQCLIAGTDGWPRHLTNALRGAVEALIAGQGDLAKSSLEAARESADAFRRQFYHEQTEPFQRMPELLAEVFGAMPPGEGARSVALRKASTQAYEDNPDLADEMPRRDVFTKLLHQGLVQDFGHDHYDCPIPSLRRYVEELCAAEGHPPPGGTLAPDSPAAPVLEPSGGMG